MTIPHPISGEPLLPSTKSRKGKEIRENWYCIDISMSLILCLTYFSVGKAVITIIK
jgi:hypothetical protein